MAKSEQWKTGGRQGRLSCYSFLAERAISFISAKAFFIMSFSGLLVSGGAFAADLSGFASDDFNSTTLDTGIWTFSDPKGDSTVNLNGTHLVITLPAGPTHDVWTTGNDAPRVMQSINNTDFELEIKFETPVNQQFQIQGMLIEQDASNFIRFDFYSNGTNTRIFAATFTNGNPTTHIESSISDSAPLYMRVNRLGDQWTQSFSVDGVVWNNAGTFSHVLAVNSAGAFAGNAAASGSSAPAHTAVIDYFFSTASPIIPEDGVTIPDTAPPFIHNIKRFVGLNQAQFTWSTDEAASGVVEYGLTTSYELGMFVHTDFTFIHDLVVTGLASNTTYNFRVHSIDPSGNESLSSNIQVTTSPFPVIDAWYGPLQDFGQLGSNSARWINILGNVSGQNAISTLSYSLNGQASRPLNIGPDTLRLQDAGDFNVEIEYLELFDGLNNVTVTATDILGYQSTENITVNYAGGNTWPLPYTADWTTATQIADVAQIVDGVWALQSDGVRTAQLGYDRLLSIGDISWDNYEVTVPITLHGLDPGCSIDLASNPCRGGPGVGVLVRWQGHHPTGAQPSSQWIPLGALGWYRWKLNPSTGVTTPGLYLIGGDGNTIVSDPGKAFPVDSTHLFKVRAETVGGQHEYKLKMWEQGQPEPAQWDLSGSQALGQSLASGSLLLVAHYTDATFGNFTVGPVGLDATPPVITTDPASQTVNAGDSVTFSVAVDPATNPAPTYQWKKGGSPLAGETAASLIIDPVAASDAGTYTVAVSNVAGTVTSAAATLTVNVAPIITADPASQTVNAGASVTFSVAVNPATNPAPTYQWKKGGSPLSGETAVNLTINPVAAADAGDYTVDVSNVAGTATSAAATLTVNVPPTIDTQPASQSVVEGGSATFTVAATGTGTLSYQWKKDSADIGGATSASYTIPVTVAADAGSYQVVVTNTVNSVTNSVASNAATLTVNVAPSIGAQPASQSVVEGSLVTFSVGVSGTTPFTYQWKRDGVDLGGATSASYTIPSTSLSDDGAVFTVAVTNVVTSVTSAGATLSVTPAPVAVAIIVDPVDQMVNEGATAAFSVVASGTAPFTYQWQVNSGSGFVDISGATGASYTTAATTPADNGASYRVVVTNVVNSVTSAAATLTINLAPTIGTQPADQTVIAGVTATFSVVASGAAPLTYQWQKDGMDIAGATGADYTTPTTTVADDGSTYQVVVSNAVSSVSSSAATLTIDSNGDGLSDGDAIALGLDPNDAGGDSDGDGVSDVAEVGGDVNNPLDSDADGVIDALEPGTDANDASVTSGLQLSGGVTATIISAGETLSAVSAADATGAPAGINFPFGKVSYTTTSAVVGGAVTVRMTVSSDLPARIDLYKVDNAGVYTLLPTTIWTKVDARTLDVTLTDGDPQTDLDGAADGSIEDPIAIADVAPAPSTSSGGGGGGGCTLKVSADDRDPTLPLLMLISVGYLLRRGPGAR